MSIEHRMSLLRRDTNTLMLSAPTFWQRDFALRFRLCHTVFTCLLKVVGLNSFADGSQLGTRDMILLWSILTQLLICPDTQLCFVSEDHIWVPTDIECGRTSSGTLVGW